MSKYIESLKRARPERLYVFDLDRTALNGGTVTSYGYDSTAATVEEDTGFAEIDVVEPLIEGVSYVNHPKVIHDRSVNNPAQYFASFLVSGYASDFFGPDALTYCAFEAVLRPEAYMRGRDNTFAAVVATAQTNVVGLGLEYDFTTVEPTVQFVFKQDYVEQANLEILRTASLDPTQVYHVALIKSQNFYNLLINGSSAASGFADETYTPVSLASNDIRIGGWNSVSHGDVTIQSVAFFDRKVELEFVKNRYQTIAFSSNYLATVGSFRPDVDIAFETDGDAVLSPAVQPVILGGTSAELYEDESGAISIQPDVLAAPVTVIKKLQFDLTPYETAPTTFFSSTKTTPANTSIIIEYSFDDATYSTLTEGRDTITEFDYDWGGVV